ncbi:hypothetical protein NOR_02460 [Metarhizium rileyi]|uniref:Uncharacterized protein n=1 Tax=Metarhizium rileyi (strain RCEF 4871) TaxID=1649241 RepID=A0A167GMA3_METRR|nr:hypothetical protein NOR_02460 [Metarhizium rileyi RCEF 4871]TWU70772.1 hypothetical protein ED733_000870 [Metarhizium rileyi]
MRPQNVVVPLVLALNGYSAAASPSLSGVINNMMNNLLGPLAGGGAASSNAGSSNAATSRASNGNSGTANGNTRQPSNQAIAAAATSWRLDTGTVSNFLSNAESMTPQQLQQQGTIALDAEKDELIHKAVLDRMFLNGTRANQDAGVADANDVLVNQSTFQFIVDGLTLISNRGANMQPDEVSTLVRAMNQDRCPLVLPAIDKYLAAAAGASNDGVLLQAVRPTNCE